MPTNKVSHNIAFRIKRSPRTKQFRCVIDGGNGKTEFSGEPCKNRMDVNDTIMSHIKSVRDGKFRVIDETNLPAIKPKNYEGHLNRTFP